MSPERFVKGESERTKPKNLPSKTANCCQHCCQLSIFLLHSNKNLSGLPRKDGYGPLHSHRASTQATADFRFCCPNENVVDHHLRTSRCARNSSTAASRNRRRFPTRM